MSSGFFLWKWFWKTISYACSKFLVYNLLSNNGFTSLKVFNLFFSCFKYFSSFAIFTALLTYSSFEWVINSSIDAINYINQLVSQAQKIQGYGVLNNPRRRNSYESDALFPGSPSWGGQNLLGCHFPFRGWFLWCFQPGPDCR